MNVTVARVDARPTFVVAAATTWQAFPSLWPALLDEVYARVQRGGGQRWQNVMLYRDDVPHVEVGVLATGPIEVGGRVVRSRLPAGEAAQVLYRGPWAELDVAHRAIHAWCAEHGRTPSRVRWEVYGHHHDDPRQQETEIAYLLA